MTDEQFKCCEIVKNYLNSKETLIGKYYYDLNEQDEVTFEFYYNKNYVNFEISSNLECSIYTELIGEIPAGWDLSFNDSFTRLKSIFNE